MIHDAEREVPQLEELTPSQKVFQNDLLLDKIVQFALVDDDVGRQMETAKSCKLVGRLWVDSVSAALQKSRPDWFNVDLDVGDMDGGLDPIEKFIDTFAGSPTCRIPPFSLTCSFEAGSAERICHTLLNCMAQCGVSLLKLSLRMDIMEKLSYNQPILFPLDPAPLGLAKLESVSVGISLSYNIDITDCKNGCQPFESLLKTVLAGTQCLNALTIYEDKAKKWSAMLENLELPHTLTTIHFEMISDLMVKLLLGNLLPRLTVLKIFTFNSDFSSVSNELERVLNKFRLQLKRLEVKEVARYGSQKPIILPVMESLEKFKWEADLTTIELSVPPTAGFDKHFPVLKNISLGRQTYEQLRKWFDNAKFCSVLEAEFDLNHDEVDLDRRDFQLVQQMQQMKQAFPNVVKLYLFTPFTKQLSHLRFIFQAMRQLQELEIELCHCPEDDYMYSDEFDALFLGLNPEDRSSLGVERENWKTLTQGNMSALKKLVFKYRYGRHNWLSPLGWNFEQD